MSNPPSLVQVHCGLYAAIVAHKHDMFLKCCRKRVSAQELDACVEDETVGAPAVMGDEDAKGEVYG